MMRVLLLVSSCSLALSSVAVMQVNWDYSQTGTDAFSAADYFAKENWSGGTVADGYAYKAGFTAGLSGVRFIRLTNDLEIAGAAGSAGVIDTNSQNRAVLFGDTETFSGTTVRIGGEGHPEFSGVQLYADLDETISGKAYFMSSLLCGDISDRSILTIAGGTLLHRADLYATGLGGLRVNPVMTNKLYQGTGHVRFYAPCGAEAVTGVWCLKAGSPFATRTGAGHALAVGTEVTVMDGAALPEKTYLKRVFSDSLIELSAPAPADGEVRLSFAELTADVRQYLDVYQRGTTSDTYAFEVLKSRAADSYRFEIGRFDAPNMPVRFATKSGCLPGTVVIRNGVQTGMSVLLDTCHLEFADPGSGRTAGFPLSTVRQVASSSQTRLTAAEGVRAVFGCVSNLVGTLVLEGSGSFDWSEASPERLSVASLELKSGATLKIPTNGLACAAFAAEAGATVVGPGVLSVPTVESLANLTVRGDAKVVVAPRAPYDQRAEDYSWEPVATNVVGTPAVWVDASAASSLTINNGKVEGWKDVRGQEFGFAVPGGTTARPALVTDEAGNPRHVYFKQFTGNPDKDISNTEILVWNRKVTGIKALFKVINCREGGGQLIGNGENSNPFSRSQGGTYTKSLFDTEYKNIAATGGEFRVNGELRNYSSGYAYPGGNGSTPAAELTPLVVEFYPLAATGAASMNFQYLGGQGYPSRNGQERLFEMIAYTNELTTFEREAVAGYLMKKWLNAERAHAEASDADAVMPALTLKDDTTFSVESERALAFASVSGAHRLVKVGAGEAYVNECADAACGLEVAEGTLHVKSLSDMPSGAYIHVDATTGLTTDNSKVTAWADCRGESYPVAIPRGTGGNRPSLVGGAINGLPVVDFGAVSESAAAPRGMTFDEVSDIRTAISVIGSANGGGFLIGSPGEHAFVDGGKTWGLWRNPYGADKSLIDGNIYKKVLGCSGAGATRTRVNAADVVGTSTGYSGSYDCVSLVTYEDVGASGFSAIYYNSHVYSGSMSLGESILYREALSRPTVERIEAALRRKWFGVETPGYRLATAASAVVAEGATLSVYGGGALTVAEVSGTGCVEGDLTGVSAISVASADLAAGRFLTVEGSVDLSGTGIVSIAGFARGVLKAGTYVLLEAGSPLSLPADGWAVEGLPDGYSARLTADGAFLKMTIMTPGCVIIVR